MLIQHNQSADPRLFALLVMRVRKNYEGEMDKNGDISVSWQSLAEYGFIITCTLAFDNLDDSFNNL